MSDHAPMLERVRTRLLDLSARHLLLDPRRGGAGELTVEIVAERSAATFHHLVRERRALGFRPRPGPAGGGDGEAGEREDQVDVAPPGGAAEADRGAPGRDLWLQTTLPPDRLQRRLHRLLVEARAAREERGLAVLHLALGRLEWREAPVATEPRFAPLLLLPVRLERARAPMPLRLRYADGAIVANLPLIGKLAAGCALELPAVADAEALSLPDYFATLERALRPGVRLHRDSLVLGLFTSALFLLWRDLDPGSWPEPARPERHPLLRGLLADGFADQGEALPEDRIEDRVGPRDLAHVLDADAAQAVAIEEVRRGRSLVILGAPGTGKSQTIVNLIATAVRAGQKVLFVAEKAAALQEVRRRLDRLGLGELCLELRSGDASSRAVLHELERTWRQGRPRVAAADQLLAKLVAARRLLNRPADQLHAALAPSGPTPYRVLGELARLAANGVAQPLVRLAAAAGWTGAEIEERRALVARLAGQLATMPAPARHPWRGVRAEAVAADDFARIGQQAGRLGPSLQGLAEAVDALRRALGSNRPVETPSGIVQLLDTCEYLAAAPAGIDPQALLAPAWRERRAEITRLAATAATLASRRAALAGVFGEAAWRADLASLRCELAQGRSWLRGFRRGFRDAQRQLQTYAEGPLPRSQRARLALLDTLLIGQRAQRSLATQGALGAAAFGRLWRGLDTDWDALAAVERWQRDGRAEELLPDAPQRLARIARPERLARLAAHTATLLEKVVAGCHELFAALRLDSREAFATARLEDTPLAALAARLALWRASLDALDGWLAWRRLAARAAEQDLAPLVEALARGRLPPTAALDAFDMAVYEPLMQAILERSPALAAFDRSAHDRLVERFCELDRARMRLARAEVALAHHAGMPKRDDRSAALAELQRELARGSGHLPVRQLLAEAGGPVQALKPVLMMSPFAVAEFLPPGAVRFDLLVVDEASQVAAAHAVGAIARADQLVVVGDDRQLPPTPLVQDGATAGEPEGEARRGLEESLLDLCVAQGMPQRFLRCHYRSRHPSLIAFVNRRFYHGRLAIPPSPFVRHPELGLVFRHVPDGVWDAAAGCNRIEARAVAQAAIEQARRRPELSLGVGCLSPAQRDAILHELELLRRAAPDVGALLVSGRDEPFFVKDVTALQGDERDVMLLSLGGGRAAHGDLAAGFGPLEAENGERRLNVLITRARCRLEVFASITADDIDASHSARAARPGVAALRDFLCFAEAGAIGAGPPAEAASGSPLEAQVAAALARHGHAVEPRVGLAGIFIDLAVRDPARPERYLLGILCDGSAYHAVRAARDRDRLRPQVLQDQGWLLHRIWSVEWWRRPDEELRRLLTAVTAAQATWAARDADAARHLPAVARPADAGAVAREPSAGEPPPPERRAAVAS